MNKLVSIIIDTFKGMSSFIASEKLPAMIFQVIENMELTSVFGNLKKRRGYNNVLMTGITTLKSMFEFRDLNDGRQLLIQDGTELKESVYSGGYGVVMSLDNIELAPALTTANWTLGAGWQSNDPDLEKFDEGVGTATPTATTNIVAGVNYKVVITLSAVTAGKCSYTLGGVAGSTLSAAKTYTDYITASTTAKIIFTPSATSARFVISGVSITRSIDKRTLGSTVDQTYPIEYNRTLRSPAGVGSSYYRPFWYGYRAAVNRFYDKITLPAGKYLENCFYNLTDLLTTTITSAAQQTTSQVVAVGLNQNNYIVIMSLLIDGYQRSTPFLIGEIVKIAASNQTISFPVSISVINERILARVTAIDIFIASIGSCDNLIDSYKYPAYYLERVDLNNDGATIVIINGIFQTASPPTYIDSVDDCTVWETFNPSNYYATITGATNTYTRVRIVSRSTATGKTRLIFDTAFINTDSGDSCTIKIFSAWKTWAGELAPALQAANWTVGAGWAAPANTLNKNADGTGAATPTAATTISAGVVYKVIVSVIAIVGYCEYTLGGVLVSNLIDGTYTNYILTTNTNKISFAPLDTDSRFEITAVSITTLTDPYIYNVLYDNHYKILGAEMSASLNIPAGDTGLTDYKHKYGCIANNRYFAFGFTDGFAYFSSPYAPDVLCSQNIIIPRRQVTGCVSVGRDVIMFYKDGGSRVTVFNNAQIDQDDDFLNTGCVGHKTIVKLSDNEIAFLGYSGPWLLIGREPRYIGQAIKTWFEKTGSLPYFTDAQKEACVVGFNHLKELLFFSFPTYTTAPYTTGLVFVFDIRAHKLGFEPWWILKTDIPLYNFCLADDLHLLAGNTTTSPKIVDFNSLTGSNENISTRILLGMMRGSTFSLRKKILWHKLFVDYTIGSGTVTANVYFDKSDSPVVLTAFDTNKETMIGYIKQFFELELTTAQSDADYEISRIELKALQRNY